MPIGETLKYVFVYADTYWLNRNTQVSFGQEENIGYKLNSRISSAGALPAHLLLGMVLNIVKFCSRIQPVPAKCEHVGFIVFINVDHLHCLSIRNKQ